jgi:hypothetical protein
MNDKNLTLLKQNIINEAKIDSDLSFRLPPRSWFKQHKNGISGVVCLVVAILLPTLMVLQLKQILLTPYNFGIVTVIMVLSLYCLVKGIFTLLFQSKETEFGTSVHQYLIINSYNRLYFVYERMVWLWILFPVLLATLPSFIGLKNSMTYWIIAVSLYIVALLSFGRPQWRKMKQLKEEINQLDN